MQQANQILSSASHFAYLRNNMPRRCQPCRQRRVRCDKARPVCGSCLKGGWVCTYLEVSPTRFIDQNQKAAEGSRRARASPRQQLTVQLYAIPSYSASDSPSRSKEEDDDLGKPRWLTSTAWSLRTLSHINSNDVLVTQLFERWILHPCNHGVCPGYFQDVLAMYHSVAAQHSLKLTVHAIAYAELARRSSRASRASVRAQQLYGQALCRVQTVVRERNSASDDSLLASILLLDTFEKLFVDVGAPVTPHADGMVSLLRLRGSEQFFTNQGYHLWRLAHHRVQMRKLLHLEEPMEESEAWMNMLEKTEPDSMVADQALKVVNLNAAAKKLIDEEDAGFAYDRARILLDRMSQLDQTMMITMDGIDSRWKAKQIHPDFPLEIRLRLPETTSKTQHALYHDLWAARTWNYHRVCRIMLHQMQARLKMVVNRATPSSRATTYRYSADGDMAAVSQLSSDILLSVPMLLGMVQEDGEYGSSRTLTNDVGKLFLMIPMHVIQRCEFSSQDQKVEAAAVLRYTQQKLDRKSRESRLGLF